MWWTLLIPVFSPALAQECGSDGLDVLAVSPEPGASDVPRDARVVLQLRGAGDFDDLGAVVSTASGAAVEGQWRLEWTASQAGLATFEPAERFAPDAAYFIELGLEPVGSDDSEAWAASFMTSGGVAEGVLGRPSLAVEDVGQVVQGVAGRCEPDVFRRVQLRFDPATTEDPSGEWFLLRQRWEDEDDVLLATRRIDGRDWQDALEVLVPTADDAFCVVGVHRDVSGHEVETTPACWAQPSIPDEDQVAYFGGGRCATVGWGGAAWVVLLPWWTRRRR